MIAYALVRVNEGKIIQKHWGNDILYPSIELALDEIQGAIAHSSHCHPSELAPLNVEHHPSGIIHVHIAGSQFYNICPVVISNDDDNRIESAIEVLVDCAMEAPHHKNFGYAQALKILMGESRYNNFIQEIIEDENDRKLFEGVAP